jgi:hypothetical protein
LGLVTGHGRETQAKPHTSLWFLDNNTLAVTFVTREAEPGLSSRGQGAASSALRLRAVFLDAATGKVLRNQTWPADTRFAGIVAAHDSKFVVQTGNVLQLYSADLTVIARLELASAGDNDWHAYPSPAGTSILFVATNLRTASPVPWVWVDTDRLQAVRSWNETQSGWVSVSDHNIAMTTCVWVYDCKPEIRVRGLQTDWKTVAGADRRNQQRPQFVDDDTLMAPGNPSRLIRADGQIILAGESPGKCALGDVYPSSAGRRFIVPSCKVKGAVATLDVGGYELLHTLFLYDTPFHWPSYAIGVNGPPIRGLASMTVSPDGLRLAILADRWVELLPLPPLP